MTLFNLFSKSIFCAYVLRFLLVLLSDKCMPACIFNDGKGVFWGSSFHSCRTSNQGLDRIKGRVLRLMLHNSFPLQRYCTSIVCFVQAATCLRWMNHSFSIPRQPRSCCFYMLLNIVWTDLSWLLSKLGLDCRNISSRGQSSARLPECKWVVLRV